MPVSDYKRSAIFGRGALGRIQFGQTFSATVVTSVSGGAPLTRREILVSRTRPLLSFSFRLRYPITGRVVAKPKRIRVTFTEKPLPLPLVKQKPVRVPKSVKPRVQIYSFSMLRTLTGQVRTPVTRLVLAQTIGQVTVQKSITNIKITGRVSRKERWIP